MIMAGRIYLLPVTLGGDDFSSVIPAKVINLTKQLRFFIVEELRSARRYLRKIDKEFPIDESIFFVLNEHTANDEIESFLNPAKKGYDIGLMSEAGLPCIADPGARIVSLAHKNRIEVIPLSGPSSIILALIASGFNGQNFTFNGYLPVKPADRALKIKELEKRSMDGCTQIFMETPYRNQNMFDSLVNICSNETRLCIAADITLSTESIKTMKISDWKKNVPSLKERLVIFLLQ
jgi:16S rRNA (cytidine1402-2'-O)-methyltransferase